MDRIITKGRRKKAIARVNVIKGKGEIIVNKKKYNEYFTVAELIDKVNFPLELTESKSKFDIHVNVKGGGIKGQAEAVRLAISKALCEIDEGNRAVLKPEGLLTRDPRMVERKKPGRKKARKQFQFSKR